MIRYPKHVTGCDEHHVSRMCKHRLSKSFSSSAPDVWAGRNCQPGRSTGARLRAGARKNVVSAMETLRRTSTVLAQVNLRPKEEKFLFHLRHRALNSCRERRMAPMLSLPAHLPRYVNGALAFNSEHSNAGFRFSAARYPFQIWYLHWLWLDKMMGFIQ